MATKRCLHEAHAFNAVVDVCKQSAGSRNRVIFKLGCNLKGRVSVNLRKRLEKSLGMTRGKAGRMVRGGAMGASLCQPDGISIERRVPEEVGMLLVEGDGALCPIYAQAQSVSLAGGNLAGDQVAARAGFIEERKSTRLNSSH